MTQWHWGIDESSNCITESYIVFEVFLRNAPFGVSEFANYIGGWNCHEQFLSASWHILAILVIDHCISIRISESIVTQGSPMLGGFMRSCFNDELGNPLAVRCEAQGVFECWSHCQVPPCFRSWGELCEMVPWAKLNLQLEVNRKEHFVSRCFLCFKFNIIRLGLSFLTTHDHSCMLIGKKSAFMSEWMKLRDPQPPKENVMSSWCPMIASTVELPNGAVWEEL